MARSYDVWAYVYEGALYCERCVGDAHKDDPEYGAIFQDNNEADYPQHCDACHAFLENALTSYGVENLKQHIREGHFDARLDLLREYLDCYGYEDFYVIPTFVGMMDAFGNIKLYG